MSQVLLCLHGWGGSKESFAELRDALKDADLTILTPDLPGFGSEPEPDRPWSVDDYADWVENWCQKPEANSQQPIAIIGHSHGGRIALKLAARSTVPIEHLYLCASAGIYHRRLIRRAIGFLPAKTGKFLLAIPGLRRVEPLAKRLLYRVLRVHDYERASPVMRETLKLVRNENLTPLLASINIPTDIFWGTKDTMTPFGDGQLMHRSILHSTFHPFPGMRHGIHRTNAREIADVIRSHLR